jgi:hypothetical protein
MVRWCRPLLILLAMLACARSAPAAGITEAARLAAVYDDILAARFDRARTRLQTACPPAPDVACRSLGLAALWWQIVLDPDSRALDSELESTSAAVIAAAQAWTDREPRRAEAWFYLAGSYGPVTQWRVLRGERLTAARDGNRIRAALERALALDPSLDDALFGIGLYHYYADVAPAAAKILRFLLLLPGGNRRQGLREMLAARDRGALLKGEADFQLHYLYLWYERSPPLALDLLQRLDSQYPSNPVFLQRIAEIQHDYQHDYPASAATWERLLARARSGAVSAPELAEARARLGLAAAFDAAFESDRAAEEAQALIRMRPRAPAGALARAYVQLGESEQRLGRSGPAAAAFEEAVRLTSREDPAGVRERARAGLRRRVPAWEAEAYRLSLDAVRALARGDRAAADAAANRARTLAPTDPVVVVRHARVRVARGEGALARADLERVLRSREAPPAIVRATAHAELAALLEGSGERARAIEHYRRAAETAGGDPDARSRAREALKRLAS